jgi:hypothetical protein
MEEEDRGQIAAQYDHMFRTIRNEINAAHQRAELVGGLSPRLLVATLVVKSSIKISLGGLSPRNTAGTSEFASEL